MSVNSETEQEEVVIGYNPQAKIYQYIYRALAHSLFWQYFSILEFNNMIYAVGCNVDFDYQSANNPGYIICKR